MNIIKEWYDEKGLKGRFYFCIYKGRRVFFIDWDFGRKFTEIEYVVRGSTCEVHGIGRVIPKRFKSFLTSYFISA